MNLPGSSSAWLSSSVLAVTGAAGNGGATIFLLLLCLACVSLFVWMLFALRRLLSAPDQATPTQEMDLKTALNSDAGRRILLLNVRTLVTIFRELVARRYSERTDIHLLEVGPGITVSVPAAFGKRLHQYTVVDREKLTLEANRERLATIGLADISQHIDADVKDMSTVPADSQDIAVACFVPVFATGSAEEQGVALKELARALKPGGELVILPWNKSVMKSQPEQEVLSCFEVVDEEATVSGAGTEITATVLLRKPAPVSPPNQSVA